ncbi:MAG TPA: sulfatase, partial [Gemmatimonadaceae bacterium]|nr:sulfatase [Gemmatimonadaceae bacterium]
MPQRRFEHTPAGRAREVLLLAITCALTAAAWHVGVITLRGRILGRLTWTSDALPWMAPVAYVTLFLLLALPLALLVRFVHRRGAMAASLFILLSVAGFSMLMLVPRVEPIALSILALGLAVSLTRILAASDAAWRGVRLLMALSSAACLLLAGESIAHRLLAASGGSAVADDDAPNVLLVILDTVREANLSVYGYERETTPALQRLADDGMTFTHAIAPSSWTLPSHASMFTGRPARDLDAFWRVPWNSPDTTLAERLRERGYATGGFVANLLYTHREVGLARGFDRYQDFVRSPRQFLGSTVIGQLPWLNILLFNDSTAKREVGILGSAWRLPRAAITARKHAAQVTDEFLDWQGGLDGQPFFAFLNYFDAHTPYDVAPEFEGRFGGGESQVDRYDGAIASIDAQLGRLFDELRRRGVLKRTLVIVTADHGEQFGEHGLVEHGNSLYGQVLRVPLILRLPGRVPAGVRIDAAVSTTDIGATIFDAIDAAKSPGAHPAFRGRSLLAATMDSLQATQPLFAWVSQNSSALPGGPNQLGAMEAI